MKKIGEIYLIEINGINYVGSANGSCISRWSTHLRLLKNDAHHNKKLQQLFNCHGIKNFKFSVIETNVDSDNLLEKEYIWSKGLLSINKLPNQYIKQEKYEEIFNLIKSGENYRNISKKLNVSLGVISKINSYYKTLSKHDIPTKQ